MTGGVVLMMASLSGWGWMDVFENTAGARCVLEVAENATFEEEASARR